MAPAMTIRTLLLPTFLLLALSAAPVAGRCEVSPADADFESATVCIECHAEIHKAWAASEHATAFTDPDFQVPYDRIRRENPLLARPCEQCHNPMRFILGADDPRSDIFAHEGVTCDFCHSVERVDAKGPWPRYRATPGIKFGPQGGNPANKAHVSRFSRLHITSEFCAGCHEFRNEYGVPILSTVSEWEQSFYRGEQVHCQYCHLPQLFDARFIDNRKEKGLIDHGMVGGHSPERLALAIPVKAVLRFDDEEAELVVSVKNDTVGHKTPSGLPMHKLRLSAELLDAKGARIDRKEERFERVIGDGAGNPLEKPEEAFTDGREVLKDNRIGPKETRVVAYRFPLGGRIPASGTVSLAYERPTLDPAKGASVITTPITTISVPAKAESPWLRYLVVGGVAAALVVAFLALRRR